MCNTLNTLISYNLHKSILPSNIIIMFTILQVEEKRRKLVFIEIFMRIFVFMICRKLRHESIPRKYYIYIYI